MLQYFDLERLAYINNTSRIVEVFLQNGIAMLEDSSGETSLIHAFK